MAQPLPHADASSEAPYVLCHREGGVVTLTLNRGDKFNPLSEEMLAALQAEVDAIAKDPAARVVVLAATNASTIMTS